MALGLALTPAQPSPPGLSRPAIVMPRKTSRDIRRPAKGCGDSVALEVEADAETSMTCCAVEAPMPHSSGTTYWKASVKRGGRRCQGYLIR